MLAILGIAVLSSACGQSVAAPQSSSTSFDTRAVKPGDKACQVLSHAHIAHQGRLTIATASPAYEPWFMNNQPASGEGFESGLAYALAAKLGYTSKQIRWQELSFDQLLAPGHKGFDLAISEISSQAKHAKSVSLSQAYFRLTQSVVVLASSGIPGKIDRLRKSSLTGARAKPLLRSLRFGVVKASSSSAFLHQVLKPKFAFHRYRDLDAAAEALRKGEIDAVLASTPDAWLLAHQRLKGAMVLGHFLRGPEGLSLAVSTPGIPLRCVNRALRSLAAEGITKKLAEHSLAAYRVIPAL